jgi:hypothetical protein
VTIPYQTSRKSLIYKNHFGNYERVTFYHPITEFDDVAPRIAFFNDGELSKEDGNYRVPGLLLGSYQIEASSAGFDTNLRWVPLRASSDEMILDITLKAAELQEAVQGPPSLPGPESREPVNEPVPVATNKSERISPDAQPSPPPSELPPAELPPTKPQPTAEPPTVQKPVRTQRKVETKKVEKPVPAQREIPTTRGEPFTVETFSNSLIKQMEDHFEEQGETVAYPLLSEKVEYVIKGFQIAYKPGTRQEIWITHSSGDHIMMLKPT